MSDTLIGIVSIYPEDISFKQRRLKAHIKQLNQINKLYPDIDIFEINIGYEDKDIALLYEAIPPEKYDIAKYDIHRLDNISITQGRNKILKRFYDSQYKLLLLLDDYSFIYPYYDVDILFDDLISAKFKGLLRPLIPSITPFKKRNYEQRDTIRNFWILKSLWTFTPFGIFILSNIKQSDNIEVYFDETIHSSRSQGYDDYDFVLKMIKAGLPSYGCNQIICRTMISTNTRDILENTLQRKQNHIANITATYDRYKSLGIRYKVIKGRVHNNLAMIARKQRIIYIPRSKEYEISPNLIPANIDEVYKYRKKLLI